MPALLSRVRQTVRRYGQLAPGDRILVGLSGGADSVALTHALLEIAPAFDARLVGAAHVNHGLRGEESDGDEAFCRELAAVHGLAWRSRRVDVAARARASHRSIEDAARAARYEFLREVAAELGATRIATGHTRDDQAETVLLRVLRGASVAGLAGIRPCVGPIIRPLLDVRRADIEEWLTGQGLPWREDRTNADTAIPRNRVRHELLPYLARAFSPGVVDVLAREADTFREIADWLDGIASEAATSFVLEDRRAAAPVAAFASLPRPVQSALAHRLLSHVGGSAIGRAHVEAALDLVEGREGGGIDLPGMRLQRQGPMLVARAIERGARRTRPAAANRPGLNFSARPLSIPGEVQIDGWRLEASAPAPLEPAGTSGMPRGPFEIAVDAATLGDTLEVRSRAPGDWLSPLGLGGRKKIQDLFVDRKVPRPERDAVPLVLDARGRIVWVVGHAMSDPHKLTRESSRMVILKATRLGGVG